MVYVLLIDFLGIKGEWGCLVPLLKDYQTLDSASKVLLSLCFGRCWEHWCEYVLLSDSAQADMCQVLPGTQTLCPGDTATQTLRVSLWWRGQSFCDQHVISRGFTSWGGSKVPVLCTRSLMLREHLKQEVSHVGGVCASLRGIGGQGAVWRSSFSWQKEDIQSARGHRQKDSFVLQKTLAATQALLCQCSPLVRVRVFIHSQLRLCCREQQGNS